MTWVAKLLPREEQFFPLFAQHAQKLLDGAKTLRQLLHDGPDRIRAHSEALTAVERSAKDEARKTLDAVRLTFVTPFNRVDIKGLISEIDYCLRDMRKAARAAMLFANAPFDSSLQEIGDVVVECAELVKRAMPLLPDIDRKAGEITEITRKIGELRARCDELFDRGLTQAAGHGDDDPATLFKISMVYDRLEAVTDGMESIASSIHDVVIDQV